MKSVWDNIEHFSPKENWGSPERMDPLLLYILDLIRYKSGIPIVIHNGFETDGHSKTGYHPKGKAADWYFVSKLPFRYLYELVEKILDNNYIGNVRLSDVVGLGVYPFWNNPGFHTDSRGFRARWMRNEKGEYVEINLEEL